MRDLISIIVAGFSVVSAVILFFTYAFLMQFPHKSWYSLLSGALLMLAMTVLQLGHVSYFLKGQEPLKGVDINGEKKTPPRGRGWSQ